MSASAFPSKRVALVIGNTQYEPQAANLLNPSNDARAIAGALTRIGFSGVRPSGEYYEVDFTSAGVVAIENVNQQQLCRALAALGRAAEQAQQAVLYFAGHGVQFREDNYLIPVGARLGHARDVDLEATSLTRILNAIEGASGVRIVILDACRNNIFRSRLFGDRGSGGQGLRSIDHTPRNTLVAFAAKHGSTADDGFGRNNSPFAEALLENIELPGLEVSLLFRKVTAKVYNSTNGAQEPWVYGLLDESEHFFVPPTPAVAQIDRSQHTAHTDLPPPAPRPRVEDQFQDTDFCPPLIRIPAGQFWMGSLPSSDPGSRPDEGPPQPVKIQPFAAGLYPVTIGFWEQARKRGFGGNVRKGGRDVPVTHVSWNEAKAYTEWLSQQTKHKYRLLTEAEWEYACRAGSLDAYSTGPQINTFEAWFSAKYVTKNASDEMPPLRPIRVGVFSPNKFGLYDMHGNVYEWVEDDYHFSYKGAPRDGSAWVDNPSTNHKVLRGGCYASGPRQLRSARRVRCPVDPDQPQKIGFRIARSF